MTRIRRLQFGLIAISLISPLSFTLADEPANVLKDSFDGQGTLKWMVIRRADDHLSFEKNKGCLTLTTQRGTIHGDEKNDQFSAGTQAKNIHLVDHPVKDNVDFVATVAVKHFKPQLFYHQVGLIAYRDDDNYVKWSMEQTANPAVPTNTVIVCEKDAQPSHDLITGIEIDGPLWLRLERLGSNWICSHSIDGETFQAVGVKDFDFSDAEKPFRVGFLAKNGGNPAAAEIDVQFDAFEIKFLVTDEPAKNE